MILVLAVRFRKHIALFLCGIFYMQGVLSAETMRYGYFSLSRYEPSHRVDRGIHSWSGTRREVDSTVIPDLRHAAIKKVSAYPTVAALQRVALNKTPKPGAIGGPTQPEMQSFQSVNGNNMVDLFSGDFSYNIPLMDVGGYPVNIAYHSGVSMDEDASWVGLGWNINPGSITRNMRGLPDDFNGGTDTLKKVANIKTNKSIGVTVGVNNELIGLPFPGSTQLGVFHSTYTGWGLEAGLNASINAGNKSHGPLSGGLSLGDNSQNGLTLSPSLSNKINEEQLKTTGGFAGGLQLSLPYNSRTGIKSLQLGLSDKQGIKSTATLRQSEGWSTGISFAAPAYTPTISLPLTNKNFSFTAKSGLEFFGHHPNLYLSGYYGEEFVAAADTAKSIPAYGYLNYQNIGSNWGALTDFNREKEIPYREKPAVPHIAVPAYTYDVFTISGEGTGGMFRAYRSDIGFIADHLIQNKSKSGAASIDFGGGEGAHWGVDLNGNYSVTQSGPWLPENTLKNNISFQGSKGLFEAAYFRNPGEKTINTTAFYNAIGGDDVVTPSLFQPGNSGPSIIATSNLLRYSSKQQTGTITLDSATARKNTRDKRSEVISYLTASEAAVAGLDKYIYHYGVNQFYSRDCEKDIPDNAPGNGTGLYGYYYKNAFLDGDFEHYRVDPRLYFNWAHQSPFNNATNTQSDHTDPRFPNDNFSVRWVGRLKAPTTGTYSIATLSDDGVRLFVNDSLVISHWDNHPILWDSTHLNLVAGHYYNIRYEYYEAGNISVAYLAWRRPGNTDPPFNANTNLDSIPAKYLYPPVTTDTFLVNPNLTREDRVNNFRKSSHLSEIDVLNPDGRRYVYGIPVYNILQKEVSFSVDAGKGNFQTGLTAYTNGIDNTTKNSSGKDGYYSREEIPAYAHSFLLTGILSPDYVDVTGDGISDDDIGDAVRFNYSKTSGIANPFGWRAPYIKDSANYNEGFRSYNRDDKAHYISGSKELWYMHSIESKTMVANFTLQPRADLLEINEQGAKSDSGKAMCLKQIDLYSKADYMQRGTAATPIKTVHFEYSYELCRRVNRPLNDSGKLTLKRIWFTYNGNDKGVINPYVFHYHSNNPQYDMSMADKWGTYKDPAQNPGATSLKPINNAEYPYALQDSALAARNAAAWTMDSIQLPSGGRIKIDYESDDYAYVQNRRATQLFKIAGLGKDNSGTQVGNVLYKGFGDENLYVYVRVSRAVTTNADLFARYLDGIGKFYFRVNVNMPKDDFGSGSEYVPCYADPDLSAAHWYGITNDSTIWIKLKGVNVTGDGDGLLNPLAQTAINFLRLNLPSKAYPGSELNEDLNGPDAVKALLAVLTNITSMFSDYSSTARGNGWARQIETDRSYVRLNCPILKKYGGGLRVKQVLIYDNWKAMTGKKETVYGQRYDYTTTQSVNGIPTVISSGVATWEPSVGGEENPFHLPIEYVDKATILAPAASLYTEEPLGETFYPGASIGYSKVRVRSVHTGKTRSANGYAETSFYTSYDFPSSWDWSVLDNNTKKRYKPILSNFLRINAKNFLSLSQGFKVELNDMNGKMRAQATYAETDSVHPISFTENFYKVDNPSVQFKHLNNTVTTIDPAGNIDTAATIGKDAELMTDMRDQTSSSIGANININGDMFIAGAWPVILPSLLSLYQQETNRYRSVAMMKVIQRYGILDSVVHMDKGSIVSSKNLLYDAETGDPLLVRTRNEFNDSLFQFTYPSHWAYTGTGPAYQNIGATLIHLKIDGGKIIGGLPLPDTTYLAGGDELLAYSKQTISSASCVNIFASFPDGYKLWVIDTNLVHGGTPRLFLVDKDGTPFSGNDVALKVTRSGHRNLGSTIGSVTSLANPLVADNSHIYHLVFDTTTRVLSAGANELQQTWRVADRRKSDIATACIYTPEDSTEAAAEGCSCLKPFFNYLIASHQLFWQKGQRKTVQSLVNAANSAGYTINLSSCPLLSANASQYFYTTRTNPVTADYQAVIGRAVIDLRSISGLPMPLYSLVSGTCDALGRVRYRNPGATPLPADTVTQYINPEFSVNLLSAIGTSCPSNVDSLMQVDDTSDRLLVENSLSIDGFERNAVSILNFGRLDYKIPVWANIISAKLILQADLRGHHPPEWPNANSVNPLDSLGVSLSQPAGWFAYQPLDTMLYQAYYTSWFGGAGNRVPFQSDTIDVADYISGYLNDGYASSTFVLTQGAGGLRATGPFDSAMVAMHAVPPYLTSGYGNYYSTFYSERYTDPSKRPVIKITYVNPPSLVDTLGAVLQYNATLSCSTVTGRTCYSAVTDTVVNPYQYGIEGDFRLQRGYVYYGQRKESDPSQATNIRTNGVIKNFAPFWTLQSGRWAPVYDTTRWVWNSQTTLFSRKGFELENKDPLGRYNAGLYGYGLTMPIAVIQNSHFQESAFEGFEDYGYTANSCDTACPEARPFDFTSFRSNISDSMAHTGLFSLRIPTSGSVSLIGLKISAATGDSDVQLSDSLSSDACLGTRFDGVKTSANTVLPSFTPFAGKRMLVSAWVKEKNACTCQSYSRDHILINFALASGSSALSLHPSGNMIEGWQRYETMVNIPVDAVSMTLTLAASDSSTTYFDDIRVLPFNAEMKSYVYNPVNLRLMAELDENNYATFYEYDDDGTLIRVKKETERGIQTIKETRSALLKDQ